MSRNSEGTKSSRKNLGEDKIFSDSTGAKFGEDREPDAYYICMFQVEREKYVSKIIDKEKKKI
jgi:hypothetical protein